jgi:steroid delta-isomerase-like uncharacterized protein
MVGARESQLEAFWKALGAEDFDAAAELYAEDASINLSGLKLTGRSAVRDHMEAFRRSFPDMTYTIERRETLPGDRVLEEWSCTGSHGGAFMGQAPTGNAVRLSAATVYEFEGECVARERSYMDMSRTMLKTGVLQRAEGS